MEWVTSLKQKIKNKSIIVGVVGLGYVGLPLAVAFSKKFKVIGYDTNSKNIEFLNQGKSYIGDVDNKKINMENFYPTSDYKGLKKCDFIIITVPTPLKEDKTRNATLYFPANSTARICKTFEPKLAISSISSKVILSKRFALGSTLGSVV